MSSEQAEIESENDEASVNFSGQHSRVLILQPFFTSARIQSEALEGRSGG